MVIISYNSWVSFNNFIFLERIIFCRGGFIWWNAFSNLELLDADITDLEATIAEANAIKNKPYTVGEDSYTLYTEDSWNKLTTALAKAETAKSYKIDKQADVDAATQKLKETIEGLNIKGRKVDIVFGNQSYTLLLYHLLSLLLLLS